MGKRKIENFGAEIIDLIKTNKQFVESKNQKSTISVDSLNFGDWPLKKTNNKIIDSKILEIRKKYRRAYKPWSAKEDDLLRQYFKENKSTKYLAGVFQRNPGAIRSRLKKIGLRI